MAGRRTPHRDPYYRCELYCNHDLGSGMSIAELFGLTERPKTLRVAEPLRRSHRLASAGPVSIAAPPGS